MISYICFVFTGSNSTRPSLGRPTLRDRSLDRHPSQRPEGMPRLQVKIQVNHFILSRIIHINI